MSTKAAEQMVDELLDKISIKLGKHADVLDKINSFCKKPSQENRDSLLSTLKHYDNSTILPVADLLVAATPKTEVAQSLKGEAPEEAAKKGETKPQMRN